MLSWERLTRHEGKRRLFADDRRFRDGGQHVVALWGRDAERRLWRVGGIVFKPEAIVGRRVDAGLAFLRRFGFVPAAAAPVQLTPALVEELARYQGNIATPERVALARIATAATPCLYVLAVDRTEPLAVPATARVVSLKGHVDPARRRAPALRDALHSSSRFLNHVHTPDEPADLVRELGLLFDAPTRAELLRRAARGHDDSRAITQQARRLYRRHPRHDLDFGAALSRIEAAVARHPDAASSAEVRRVAAELRERRAGDSARLFELVKALGADIPLWDRIVVAAEVLVPDIAGAEPLLPTVGIEQWSPQTGLPRRNHIC